MVMFDRLKRQTGKQEQKETRERMVSDMGGFGGVGGRCGRILRAVGEVLGENGGLM